MLGEPRKRLGLLIPSSNTTMEFEFGHYLPPSVSLHTARMPCVDVTPEVLRAMASTCVQGAQLLADCRPDLILYGCTSGSFIEGKGYDRRLEEQMEGATGIPTLTTSHAVLDALTHLKAKRVEIFTPYITEINERERIFFEDNGFKVTQVRGLGIVDNTEIGRQHPAEAFKLAYEFNDKDSDVLFISCTNFRTFEIIVPLSKVLGKPVVTSNQASLWAALKRLQVKADLDILSSLQ
ncbi:MAG: maleate cis-trans isomerase [Chloroflexi bacterium]|nr:maleate cis-trans isomerase [Chloroflexota bacterium]MCL5074993.1 maleate cis-trans isomerase [Chloroflexota bacterium]